MPSAPRKLSMPSSKDLPLIFGSLLALTVSSSTGCGSGNTNVPRGGGASSGGTSGSSIGDSAPSSGGSPPSDSTSSTDSSSTSGSDTGGSSGGDMADAS